MDNISVKVFKFGGSCFKNPEAFEQIISITNLFKDDKKIYVCSALQGITNKLVAIGEAAAEKNSQAVLDTIKYIEDRHTTTIAEIFKANDAKDYKERATKYIEGKLALINDIVLDIQEFGMQPYYLDYLLAYGEKLSTYLLYMYLDYKGYESEYFTGEDLIITDDNYTNALPVYSYTFERVKNKMMTQINDPNDGTIFCVTGFIGRNKIGYTTTLGRGGSDYTATIMARSVYEVSNGADVEVYLWKDVSGILLANPKFVDNPKLIKSLNYKEAAESAFFGASILHPKCLAAIEEQKIKVIIKAFDNPTESENFSVISEVTAPSALKNISTLSDVSMISVRSGALVNVPGILGKIFSILGENEISVSMVAQSSSEVDTTFVVNKSDVSKAIKSLNDSPDLQDWFSIQTQDVGIIAVIGDEINKSNHKIFQALAEKDIVVLAIAQSSNDLNVSIIVKEDDMKNAAVAINAAFL